MSKQHYTQSNYKAQRSIGYLIKRANSLMMGLLEPALEARGFTYLQYVILVWLRDGIAVSPKDICLRYRHDSGALTRVIDQMADRGLLERTRSKRDRRTVELELTAAGRKAIEELVPLVIEQLNRVLEDFSTVEFEELMRLLGKLNDRAQAITESAGAPVTA
ncbi:MAG TPA: MarR family transcriptional regulator [Steroidobacteraceae bacterium]|nr:MarR family transcriptional regulator [Steroidobacteraceae bacterium]